MDASDFLADAEERRRRSQRNGPWAKLLRRTSLRWLAGDVRRVWGTLATPSVVSIAGVRLPVDASFGPAVRRELYSGRYEREEIDLLAEHLRPGDRLLELGGGLGLLSAFAARVTGPENVLVVEANPRMVELIREAHRLNGVGPVVRSGAVAREAGTLTFHLADDFWGSSTVDRGAGRRLEVTAFPLDALIAEFAPTFIVCDIEGGEFDLFRDTDLPGVRALVVEVHAPSMLDPAVRTLYERFRALGFSPRPHRGEAHVWHLERDVRPAR